MRLWPRSLELPRDASFAEHDGPAGAAGRCLRITVDNGSKALEGWYRLKRRYAPPGLTRFFLAIANRDDVTIAGWQAPLSGRSFAAWVHIPPDAATLRIEIDQTDRTPVTVKLRPIPAIELAWRSLQGWLRQRQRTLSDHSLQQDVPAFVTFEWPPPKRSDPYHRWIAIHEPEANRLHVRSFPARGTPDQAITVLLQVRHTTPALLRRTIDSIQSQSSPHWRLRVIVDRQTEAALRSAATAAAQHDPRIDVDVIEHGRGAAAALTDSLLRVRTTYVARLDCGDTLAGEAIEACTRLLAAKPDCKLLFSDEDRIDQDGHRHDPHFKPDELSPEFLHSQNYLGRWTVCHADTVRALGGWRAEVDGAEDYDLNLRIVETFGSPSISHIALVLYHSGSRRGTSSAATTAATQSGQRALSEHFLRQHIGASVESVGDGLYRIRYWIPEPRPLVSIIIPFRDHADLVRRCVRSILDKPGYENFEIILVDNDSIEPATSILLQSYRADSRIRILNHPQPFNYSAINNLAARQAAGDYLCFLNNDVEVITEDWLEDILGYAIQPGVGCVGAKLHFPDGAIQHAGMVLGLPCVAQHVFWHAPAKSPGYCNRLMVSSNYSVLTGACLLVHRDAFWKVGGFDEVSLPVAFNDVDLCIKLRKAGYRHVFTPFARLYHLESATRGNDSAIPEHTERFLAEVALMQARYGAYVDSDPYYSPHLTRTKNDFSIRAD